MIGNNACGPHAVAYGKTADNVRVARLGRRHRAALDRRVGRRVVRPRCPGWPTLVGGRPGAAAHRARPVRPPGVGLLARAPAAGERVATSPGAGRHRGHLRRCCSRPTRRPRPGARRPDPGRARLPGHARRRRRRPRPARATGPLAIEGMDARLVDVVRRPPRAARRAGAAAGRRLAVVEVGGDRPGRRPSPPPRALAADAGTTAVAGPARRPGGDARCGGSARTAPGWPAARRRARRRWPGWEDAAVPPERLGAYLREFEALMGEHGVDGLAYGHFGDGCVHVRIDLPLADAPERFRPFVTDAARPRRLARRLAVRRARRRPGPQRAAAADVLARGRRAVRPVQAPARPGRPAQPRRARATPARSTPTCGVPARGRCSPSGGFAVRRTTAATSPRAVHRCVGVGKCRADTSGSGRVHVPVVPGHQGREGLHPRPRAGAAGDGERRAGAAGLGLAGGARGARPVPVVQGLRERLPRRRRHGHVQVRGAVPDLPRPPAPGAPLLARAGCRAGPGSRAWRRRLANAALAVRAAAPQPLLRLGGMDPRRSVPRFAARAVPALARRRPPSPRRPTAAAPADRSLLWTDSFTDSFDPAVAAGRGRRARAAGYDGESARRAGLLRAHLDHHRPARRRPARLRGLLDVLGAVRRRRRADRRAGAVVHRGAALRPARAAARRPARRARSPRATAHPGRAPRARAGPTAGGRPRLDGRRRRSPSRTATSTP